MSPRVLLATVLAMATVPAACGEALLARDALFVTLDAGASQPLGHLP